MNTRRLASLLCLVVGLIVTTGRTDAAESRTLLLATTTSVQDTGLLDALIPTFTEATGIEVQVVAVGTGAALRMGAEGNADALLTHAPDSEKALLKSGAIDQRVEIMQNYFVLAGPPTDPAGTREAASAIAAIKKIESSKAPFVSRADDSGTHKREVALFQEAGLDPDERWPGYTRTGSGMGLSLQVASQKQAYILSDIGTFLAFKKETGLEAMTGRDPSLRNVYSVMRVSPTKHPRVHSKEADEFIAYLERADTKARIGQFGVQRFGQRLFDPIAAGGN
jgi:tungstate transport system substrate-binding protein